MFKQDYPDEYIEEMNMAERLKDHRKTGGQYMRQQGRPSGDKPMCPACRFKKLVESVTEVPFISKIGIRRNEM